jgi:hypothetical protein
MKKQLLVGLLALGMGVAAQAATITGSITFAGTVQLNTGSAGTATQVTSWMGVGGAGLPTVQSSSGSFAGLNGNSVTFAAPWIFNSGTVAVPLPGPATPALWSVGGFTFNLATASVFSQGGFPAGVTVTGIGTITGTGGPVAGTWSFTTQDPGAGSPAIFSFSAASGAIVPDGGSTVALLGLALVGVEALRRTMKMARRA